MKNIKFGFLFVSIMFSSLAYGGGMSSSVDCDNKALTAYEKYRTALLRSQFNLQEVLVMLNANYEEQISKGMLYRYFMALRLGEAKISKILSYSASCSNERIYLYLKIEDFNTKFSRKSMTFRLEDKKIIVTGSSKEMPGTTLFKNKTYKPIPKNYFKN